MKVYGTSAETLEDAMRLSAAMTRKLAVAGLPFGGGKAVIAVPEIPSGEKRRALFSGTAISSRRWVAPIGRART
jgi:glutamate dehydrogenase/leucine dehydrogenase